MLTVSVGVNPGNIWTDTNSPTWDERKILAQLELLLALMAILSSLASPAAFQQSTLVSISFASSPYVTLDTL